MTGKIIGTVIFLLFLASAAASMLRDGRETRDLPGERGLLSDTVELTSLKHWPQPKKQIPPIYPEQARLDKVEAEVMLSVLIGKDGAPKKIRVGSVKTSFMKDPSAKRASGEPGKKYAKMFHQPSIDAVMNWRFTRPLKPDSTAAFVWVNVPLKYQLTLDK